VLDRDNKELLVTVVINSCWRLINFARVEGKKFRERVLAPRFAKRAATVSRDRSRARFARAAGYRSVKRSLINDIASVTTD